MKRAAWLLLLLSIAAPAQILDTRSLETWVEKFNRANGEATINAIDNASAAAWMRDNVPNLDCPDKELEEIYYFRWWTYRKHIRKTPSGYVVTEFLPDVPWAGKYDTISCAAGHHLYEGRWIRDKRYLDDYSKFWFRGGGAPRLYSFWAADAVYARFLASGDFTLAANLLPDLIANYRAWEASNLDSNGLFWQIDDRDGMEISIGGSGYRPTINSYMFGDAMAIAQIAALAGKEGVADEFRAKARRIRALVDERLWNDGDRFYEVLPRGKKSGLANVRELIGYVPWYFHLPGPERSDAWKQLFDVQGFSAPFGPTTAERRHPRFRFANPHECLWNGPSWPFATTQTLVALANLLNDYRQDVVSRQNYFDLLKIYARSQHRKGEGGEVVPWIDEDLDPDTGDWIARRILQQREDANKERGHDYNHSAFADVVITGLVGLRPRADDLVDVNPLLPAGTWTYFCLDHIRYHGHDLTVLWDETGKHYGKGAGLRLFDGGHEIAHSGTLGRLQGKLEFRNANR